MIIFLLTMLSCVVMLLGLKKHYWYNIISLMVSFFALGLVLGIFEKSLVQYIQVITQEISILGNGIIIGVKLMQKVVHKNESN